MAERRIDSRPLAYFITIHTYGTWLHGEKNGSVDDNHNRPGTPFIPPNEARRRFESDRCKQLTATLDSAKRRIVDATIRQVCAHRGWMLHALHARTTHVHIVVTGPLPPERIMNDCKAWSTRRLREAALIGQDEMVWSRHGSTRYLWDEVSIAAACDYTLNRQGVPLDADD